MDAAGIDLSPGKFTFDLESAPTPIKVRGRKRKPASAGPPPKLQKRPRTLQGFKAPTRQLSRLEQLPFDIIEPIFLYSLNVNLPRASNSIGAILSTEHTYLKFCKQVFCASEGADTSPCLQSVGDELQNRGAWVIEQHSLKQSRDLAVECRWATYSFFVKLKQHVEHEPDLRLGLLSCRLPAKLLKWPLSHDERLLLQLLASNGSTVDPINSLDGEKVEDVWRHAMVEKDMQLCYCLMRYNIQWLPDKSRRRWALDATDFDINVITLFRQARVSHNGNVDAEDWPIDWPMSDPYLSGRMCDMFRMEHHQLANMVETQECSWAELFTNV